MPRRTALACLGLTLAAIQFSIAIGQIFLALALVAWAVTLIMERRRPAAPAWMLPLALYAGWTLISAAVSPDVAASLHECRQLVLLLLVPLTYDIVTEESAVALTTVILAAGAASAGTTRAAHIRDFVVKSTRASARFRTSIISPENVM